MKTYSSGFPLPLIGVAVAMAITSVWISMPGIVLRDWGAASAGLSIAYVLVPYAAYKLNYAANADKIEDQRVARAGQVAWVTLFMMFAALVLPNILSGSG